MSSPSESFVCNLDARGSRTRWRIGAALAGVSVLLAAFVILRRDLSPWWSLVVLPPAYGAAVGFLQAKEET